MAVGAYNTQGINLPSGSPVVYPPGTANPMVSVYAQGIGGGLDTPTGATRLAISAPLPKPSTTPAGPTATAAPAVDPTKLAAAQTHEVNVAPNAAAVEAKYQSYKLNQQAEAHPAAAPGTVKVWDSNFGTGGVAPAPTTAVAETPDFAGQQQRLYNAYNAAVSNAMNVTRQPGYKMGDRTAAFMQMQSLGQTLAALTQGAGGVFGDQTRANTAITTTNANNATTLANTGLAGQNQLANTDLAGQYALKREQLQGDNQLLAENAKLSAKANSGETAKSLQEAEGQRLKNLALAGLLQGQTLSPAALGVLGYNTPTPQVAMNPNAVQGKDGTWNTEPVYVSTPQGVFTQRQYQALQANGKI